MKTLLLLALVMAVSSGTQASILSFSTVSKCQTYTKQEPVTVDVQEAQDGQAQLVIAYTPKGEVPLKIQVKRMLPPPMNAGMPLKYIGKNNITKELVTLAIGISPLKVGKLTGRGATLYQERQDAIRLICSAVK